MQEEQEPDEKTTQDMDVYLSVSQSLDISCYTFIAKLEENNHSREVFRFDAPDDQPPQQGFKQIPQTFHITWVYEIEQRLKIYVHERGTNRLMGSIEDLKVGELAGLQDGVKKKLRNGCAIIGQLFICYQIDKNEDELILLQVKSQDIASKRALMCFCPDSYYFTITKILKGNTCQVYRSKPTRSASYFFQPIRISTRKLCNQQSNQEFALNLYNYSNNTLIGQTSCMLAKLQRNEIFQVANGKERKGRIIVKKTASQKQYGFLSFCKSGMKIALVLAIDFTKSNLPYTDIQSQHYCGPEKNLYETVIEKVCPILLHYNYEKKVPAFGFGAKVKFGQIDTKDKVSHCFPISGNKEKPDLDGIGGILQGYKRCLPNLQFSSPTEFAPIIKESMKKCRKMKQETKEYRILMMVTDGEISDFKRTVDLIIECSRLPISIIIIGISRNERQEWTLMRMLDNNDLSLTHTNGQKAQRDLVKFVSFSDCHNNPGQLSRQVLEELPRQVQEYHRLQKIIPNKYKQHSEGGQGVPMLISDVHEVASQTFRREGYRKNRQMNVATKRQSQAPPQNGVLELNPFRFLVRAASYQAILRSIIHLIARIYFLLLI